MAIVATYNQVQYPSYPYLRIRIAHRFPSRLLAPTTVAPLADTPYLGPMRRDGTREGWIQAAEEGKWEGVSGLVFPGGTSDVVEWPQNPVLGVPAVLLRDSNWYCFPPMRKSVRTRNRRRLPSTPSPPNGTYSIPTSPSYGPNAPTTLPQSFTCHSSLVALSLRGRYAKGGTRPDSSDEGADSRGREDVGAEYRGKRQICVTSFARGDRTTTQKIYRQGKAVYGSEDQKLPRRRWLGPSPRAPTDRHCGACTPHYC